LLRHRNIAPAAICFCIGIVTAMNANGFFLALILGISGVLCLFFTAAHRFFTLKTKSLAAFCALFLIGAFYVTAYGTAVFGSADEYIGKTDAIEATVVETDSYITAKSVTLSITDSKIGLPKGTLVLMNYDGEIEFDDGDIISAEVEYYKNKSLQSKAEFIYLRCTGTVESAQDGGNALVRLRQYVCSLIDGLYGDDDRAREISSAAVGADKGAVSAYTSAIFRNGGVSHVLVVSGLHVSIITLAVSALLGIFKVPMRTRSVVAFALAVMYGVFVGFTPSILRTLLMLAFITFDKLIMRHHDSINSLLASLFVVAIINPFLLSSLSTQLSYGATLAILLILPKAEERIDRIGNYALKKLVGFFAIPLVISVSVAIVTMPITVFSGGSVSYIAPLVNMLITAVFGYVLILDLLAIILFAITGFAPVGIVSKFCYDSIYKLLSYVYRLGCGSVSTAMPGFVSVTVCAVIFIAAIMLLEGKQRRITAIASAAACCVCLITVTLAFQNYYSTHQVVCYQYTDTQKSVLVCADGQIDYFDFGGGTRDEILPLELGLTGIDRYVMSDASSVEALRFTLSRMYVGNVYLHKDADFDTLAKVCELGDIYGFTTVTLYDYTDLGDGVIIDASDDCITVYGKDTSVSVVVGKVKNATGDIIALARSADADGLICVTLIADETSEKYVYNDFYSTAGYRGAKIVIYPETEVSMLEY